MLIEFLRADLMTRVKAEQIQIHVRNIDTERGTRNREREPYEGGDQFVMGLAGTAIAGIDGGELPTLGTDPKPPIR
jgi:hypothetical protein